MAPLKKYIMYSLALHVAILVGATLVGMFTNAKKNFIVFGAHSVKPSAIRYKTSNSPTPFVKGGSGKRVGKKSGKGGKHKPRRKAKPQQQQAKQKKKNTSSKKQQAPKKSSAGKKGKQKSTPTPLPELEEIKKDRSKPKKQPQVKKIDPKIEPEEREEETVEEEKKPEISPSEELKPEPPITEEEEEEEEENTAPEDDNADWADTDEVIEFNGDTSDEKNIKIYQTHIQKEVARLWRPPLGVPKGTICTVLFYVDEKGKVQKCEIIKHSKMLIYDLSIMRVAKSFNFNKYLWNRKFTIDFRQ